MATHLSAARCLLVLLLCSGHWVSAQATPWKGDKFFMRSRGTPLKGLLRDLGANYGVPVVVSEQVSDTFSGEIGEDPPEQTLQRLARLFHLVTWYDGEVLYVYKAQEITSAVVTPQYLQPDTLRQWLKRNGAQAGSACRIKTIASMSAFEVQGVPACVQRISRLAEEIDIKAKTRAVNSESLRVFPLRFASAADMTYRYREQDVIVPGIVSVLNNMKSGNALPIGDGKEEGGQGAMGAQFSADQNNNAVLVRARQADMVLYQTLIEQLDRRQQQVEISVAIIDVDAGELRQLGIDWSGSVGSGNLGASFNSGINGTGGYMSTVIGNSAQFMARISALQQNSHAQVLSQPSVVTQNNVQAILDKNITFYTKLQGEKTAKLEAVTSGTLMRVTPRIVNESKSSDPDKVREIILQLNIQDGQQQGVTSAEEPLPQVQNSEITTQASLKAGQSLLLGGFVQEKSINTRRSIPLLGDIPLLGRLFSTERVEKHSVVRLFLIKATPLSLGE
ncbi:EscC/YscC/HrcC family type III secretion system outer membrane ring protein [Serratia quinivorans]|uniref:EscC/YscC/HrcC family type III secretion system outer membrane ring protein n=1 Tax=Serratia quinivorans TaxID=137545 RepID=UPI00217C380D|nr:EscC/YscC/HrcC family type III secretion system outer membrane ring protein [Serratia quinivorans]CAI1011306.1 outer membrane secretin SsaC [Serratia quinivorans]CAI1811622.1 outer membrane secretin SsaC [Serratia quinivorans]